MARRALDAVGRRTVLVTGRFSDKVIDPLLLPHRVMTGGLGHVMKRVARRFGS